MKRCKTLYPHSTVNTLLLFLVIGTCTLNYETFEQSLYLSGTFDKKYCAVYFSRIKTGSFKNTVITFIIYIAIILFCLKYFSDPAASWGLSSSHWTQTRGRACIWWSLFCLLWQEALPQAFFVSYNVDKVKTYIPPPGHLFPWIVPHLDF